jgi:hypothetical protein
VSSPAHNVLTTFGNVDRTVGTLQKKLKRTRKVLGIGYRSVSGGFNNKSSFFYDIVTTEVPGKIGPLCLVIA